MLYFLALLLPFLAGSVIAGLPSQTCSVPQACEAHGNNLISAVAGVNTVVECRQLCRGRENCTLISYFGPKSSPFQSYCMMFSNCSVLHDCPDCWSEDKVCFGSCDNKAEGKLFANALEIITDVYEEPTCLLSCKKNPDCKFLTHYSSLDVNYPGLCVLQKELSGPLTVCEHCRTGSSDCSDITDSSCSFVMGSDKTPVSSFMFTDPATPATVTISTLAQLLCELNVVAVGGGGSSGGGSGHVSNLNVPVPFPRLLIKVRGPGKESTFGTPGQLLLSASPGKDGGKQGGDGYSGGGGAKENGGEDGGDGPGQNGGKGSGLGLSSITLQKFSITPGEGGKYQENFGGGGVRLLMNGTGPNRSNDTGEGYGGGRGESMSDTDGTGLVLLEINRKK